MQNQSMKDRTELHVQKLRQTIDYTKFPFETTEEVSGLTGIVGQERGRKAMEFGLHVNQIGYNIYVAGIAGTGKTSYTHSIVSHFSKKATATVLHDWCYVFNFENVDHPKILKLPAGMGKVLQQDMEQFVETLKMDIPRSFNEENYRKERATIIRNFQDESEKMFDKLNDIAKMQGFVIRQSGAGFVTVPTIDGKPLSKEDYDQLNQEQVEHIENKLSMMQEKVMDFTNQLRNLEKELKETLDSLDYKVALAAVGHHIDELKEKYKKSEDVLAYLIDVEQDILTNVEDFLQDEQENPNNTFKNLFQPKKDMRFILKYTVNLLVDNSETKGAPVIIADNPTYYNLIGKAEYENRMGVLTTDFTKIKPGYLHLANGGYIIIQAKDIISSSYAWEALKRTLKNSRIQIENLGEQIGLVSTTSIKPDPIQLDVKVVLIGSPIIYELLFHYDEDFRKLFKIKADFDIEMDSNMQNIFRLASFIHTRCKKDGLKNFDRTAVARIVEYSSRLAGHQEKLSTRFNQVVEILYEADTWASMMGDNIVSAKHIKKAIDEKIYRSNLYEEKIQRSIEEGDILIDTEGKKIGQVNGLAVYQLGQYSFGKPTRITASTHVGQKGIINIERESKMSGNIHNKGVYILSGYLGDKFAQKQPLALSANLAFEQSYSGVDGDSASSTELYAILSSLAEVPIDQGLAVTGSVNQKGEIQPIGGVNEKIEGFFDVCKSKGLTGKQGVLIPHQNVKNLMLKDEVIEAVKIGQFHIYQVATVEEGIELLTGIPAGQQDEYGSYDENTVYRKVADKLKQYMEMAKKKEKVEK